MFTFFFRSFDGNRMQFNNLCKRYIDQKLLICITLQMQTIIFSVTLTQTNKLIKQNLSSPIGFRGSTGKEKIMIFEFLFRII